MIKNKLLLSVAACSLLGVSNGYAQLYSTLDKAVSSTDANKIYTMTKNETITATLGDMGGSSLIIDGQSAYTITANAPDISGITVLASDTLTIQNVFEVTGFNKSGDGGFVLNNVDATTNIINTLFTNNSASYGGVLRNAGLSSSITGDLLTYGTINITDAIFKNNSGIENSSVLSNSGVANITKSTIEYNTSGAIGSVGTLNIYGSTFNENSTLLEGGAIRSHTTGILNINTTGSETTYFTSNSASNGGAIYTDKLARLTIKNAEFSTNTATDSGGAIWLALTNYTASINAKFTSNTANIGGAIYNTGGLSILAGTTFITNNATTSGGAIYNGATTGAVNIAASLTNNYVTDGQGGAIYNATSSTIATINGSVSGNYVSATTNAFGGAVYNAGNITTISGSYSNNYTNGTTSSGGAIYNASGATIDTISASFSDNGDSKTAFGGAIYNAGTINNITGTFSDNITGIDLSTASRGGAIYNAVGGVIDVISGSFTDNMSRQSYEDEGGAIYNAGTIKSLSSNFSNNGMYTDLGGAIYNASTGNITVIGGNYTDNKVNGNSAGKGGAIYNEGSMSLSDVNFTNNSITTSGLGGAIYNSGDMSITATKTNVLFDGNNVASTDNAIYNTGTLSLNALGAYSITMNDEITGNGSGTININKDNAMGNVIINENISSNTINFLSGTLSLGRNSAGTGVVLDSLYANSAYSDSRTEAEYRKINTIDGFITNYTITNDMLLSQTKLAIDMDLRNEVADSFTVGNNLTADTGVVLINITDFIMNPTEPNEITIFNGQNSNPNLSLLEEELTILDNQKKINLTQSETNKGAYEYTISGGSYNINVALGLDAAHTQYDMKTLANSGLGDEFVSSNTIGYFDSISGKETGKDMVVNGLNGGTQGFKLTATDYATGVDSLLTLETESTYYSTNINYYGINFYMQGAGDNVITFDMNNNLSDTSTTNDFKTTTLESDFSSNNINNKLVLSGLGTYTLNGTINNLTFDANSDITANGKITDSIVNVNGLLTTKELVDNSTINVNSVLKAEGLITNSTINVDGLVDRSNYDNGVSYTLNTDGVLNTDIKYLYDGSQTTLNSITFNGGELLGFQNGSANVINLNSLSVSKQSNISLEVDLAAEDMDRFVATTTNATSGFNIEKLILLSDTTKDEVTISFTDDANLAANTIYSGLPSLSALSPLYQYQVTYDKMFGDFTFSKGEAINAFNPVVYTSTVAKDAYTLASFDIFEEVLMNADSLEVHKTKLGQASGDLPNYNKAWFKAFGTNEDIGLKHFDVDTQTYGGILGVDSDIINKNGWDTVYSIYLAYLGSNQEYQDVNIKQNGSILGIRSFMQKGNWFTGTTASIGTSYVEGSNTFGEEDFWMFSAGLSTKTGYNINLYCQKYFLQPSMTLSYLHTYTTEYKNSSGLTVADDRLNALQIKPEVKFVANLDNDIRPYASASYNINLLSNPEVEVSDTVLPDLSVDPYAEFKLGATGSFNDALTGYAEVSATTGGRDGFGGHIGLKWSF